MASLPGVSTLLPRRASETASTSGYARMSLDVEAGPSPRSNGGAEAPTPLRARLSRLLHLSLRRHDADERLSTAELQAQLDDCA